MLINQFKGLAPRFEAANMPQGYAVTATDVDLYDGAIRPRKGVVSYVPANLIVVATEDHETPFYTKIITKPSLPRFQYFAPDADGFVQGPTILGNLYWDTYLGSFYGFLNDRNEFLFVKLLLSSDFIGNVPNLSPTPYLVSTINPQQFVLQEDGESTSLVFMDNGSIISALGRDTFPDTIETGIQTAQSRLAEAFYSITKLDGLLGNNTNKTQRLSDEADNRIGIFTKIFSSVPIGYSINRLRPSSTNVLVHGACSPLKLGDDALEATLHLGIESEYMSSGTQDIVTLGRMVLTTGGAEPTHNMFQGINLRNYEGNDEIIAIQTLSDGSTRTFNPDETLGYDVVHEVRITYENRSTFLRESILKLKAKFVLYVSGLGSFKSILYKAAEISFQDVIAGHGGFSPDLSNTSNFISSVRSRSSVGTFVFALANSTIRQILSDPVRHPYLRWNATKSSS